MADRMEIMATVNVTSDGKKTSSSKNNEAIKNAKTLEESTTKAANSAEAFKNSIVKALNKSQIIGWAKLIKETINLMLDKSQAQAEYIENLNMMTVAFKDSADSASEYIDRLSALTGFDASGLTRQLGIFRQISSAMNYTSEVADTLSTNLSKMSLDISSLYNISVERAGKSLESAITGQVRSIRSLTGADITLATLQQEAYARGINKTTAEMSRAEKTILIYLSLERQLSNANGDMAFTIGSVANQTKIFKDQIVVLARNIGGLLIPVLRKVLPIINGILMALNAIIETIMALFNIDAKTLSSEFGLAGTDIDLLEEGLDGVSEASDKAKKSLRGFDKLNNITTPSSSGSGTGIGGLGAVDPKLLEALNEYNLQLDKMKNKAADIRDRIMEWLGFTKELNEETGEWTGKWTWDSEKFKKNIKDSAIKFIKSIAKWIKDNIKKILIAGVIVLAFNVVKNMFKNAEKDISKSGEIWAKAGKKIGEALKIVSIGIAGFALLAGISMLIKEFNELLKTMAETGMKTKDVLILFGGLFAEIAIGLGLVAAVISTMDWTSIFAGIVLIGGFVLILEAMNNLLETLNKLGMDTNDILILIGGLLGELVVTMGVLVGLALILGSDPLALIGILALTGAISAILLVLKATLPTILDALGDFIVKIAPFVIQLLETIGGIITDIIYALGTSLPPVIDSVGRLFDKIFGGISKVIVAVAKSIDNVLKSILTFIREAGPAINTFVDNIINAITKVINFLISGVEYTINTLIIDAINSLLKKLNKIPGVDFDLIPKVRIERFKPELRADGGFVKSGDIFYANENNKPEYVGSFGNQTAVANTDQIVDGIAIGVTKAMLATGGRDNKVVIEAKGDASGLLDFITFEQKKKDRQYGL